MFSFKLDINVWKCWLYKGILLGGFLLHFYYIYNALKTLETIACSERQNLLLNSDWWCRHYTTWMQQHSLSIAFIRAFLQHRYPTEEEKDEGYKDRWEDAGPLSSLDNTGGYHEQTPPKDNLTKVVRMTGPLPHPCNWGRGKKEKQ